MNLLFGENLHRPSIFSATFSDEDEGFINQQGVHELFAEILFADPDDFEETCSEIDENVLYSNSRSFDEEQDDFEDENPSQDTNLEDKGRPNKEKHSIEDGTQKLLEQEAKMMQRLLARTAYNQEACGKINPINLKKYLLGYPGK